MASKRPPIPPITNNAVCAAFLIWSAVVLSAFGAFQIDHFQTKVQEYVPIVRGLLWG